MHIVLSHILMIPTLIFLNSILICGFVGIIAGLKRYERNYRNFLICFTWYGSVAERLKALVLKTSEDESPS